MRIGLHDEGLVLLTPEIPGEPSEALRQERGGNGLKRISGFAHSAESRSVEAVSVVPPAAISFLSQEKRYGRKECLDAVGASCGYVLDRHRVFSRYEHT